MKNSVSSIHFRSVTRCLFNKSDPTRNQLITQAETKLKVHKQDIKLFELYLLILQHLSILRQRKFHPISWPEQEFFYTQKIEEIKLLMTNSTPTLKDTKKKWIDRYFKECIYKMSE